MDNISQICESKEGKLFTFLIVFMALGNVYQLPGIPQLGVGEILLIAFIPFYYRKDICLLPNKESLGFVIFFLYLFFVSLFVLNLFDGPLSKLISVARVAFYWIIIFFFGQSLFSISFFKKCVFVFALLLSSFIILQFFTYAVTGYYISGLIPNAPLNQGGVHGLDAIQHYLNMAGYMGFIRPSGFLLEPAHCVQFLFICSLLFISEKNITEKMRIICLSLILLAMLIAQSSTGIVLTLFSVGYLAFINKNFKIRFVVVSIISIYTLFFLLNGFSLDNWAFDRLLNILSGTDIDNSSYSRLNNGFNLFLQFPFVYKIFGTGMGMFDLIAFSFGFENSLNYMNCFSFVLFASGVLGTIIWLLSLARFFSLSSSVGKTISLGFFVMSLGCSIFCQPQMVWFFLLILADIREKNAKYSGYPAIR